MLPAHLKSDSVSLFIAEGIYHGSILELRRAGLWCADVCNITEPSESVSVSQ